MIRQLQITPSITNRETESVEAYFHEIAKVDLITPEEEVILAQKIRNGDQAALEQLTRANLRFVVSVAKKYQNQGLPLGDLISEGNIGLIKAAKRFDETRGFKFISFAVWWIRQSIMAAITENARVIRLPMNTANEISMIHKAATLLEQQLWRPPATVQLAEYLQIAEERVVDALHVAQRTIALDGFPDDPDDYTLLDKIPSPDTAADSTLLAESFRFEMNRLLSGLSGRERQIIELTYGMTGEPEMSPADISPHVGLSTVTVRQIRNDALAKLRGLVAIAGESS
jgi:RNA polymerase primary sigma factor